MSEDKPTLTERKALPHLTWMHYLKELERENPQPDQRDLTVVHAHAIRADKMKFYTFAKVSARGYLTEGLRLLLRCNRDGSQSIVCCAFGSNRSRTAIEEFHYAKMGHHLEDEYEGFLEGFLSRQGFSFFSLTFENHLNLIVREWVLQPISDLL